MLNNLMIEVIKRIVCSGEGINPDKLFARSRERKIINARQLFFKLIRMHTELSLSEIGKIAGLDHATIIHAIKKLDGYLSYDKKLRRKFDLYNEAIKEELESNKFSNTNNGFLRIISEIQKYRRGRRINSRLIRQLLSNY